MHVHRVSRTRKTTLSITLLFGLAIAWFAVARAATATSGFTITSSTSVLFWVHDAAWADLHYQINSGVQLNVRMVASGTNHTFDVTAVPSGATVRYFFTIGSTTGGATDTPMLILRMVVQLGAVCATASAEPKAAQAVASDSSVVQRFNMTYFLPVGCP